MKMVIERLTNLHTNISNSIINENNQLELAKKEVQDRIETINNLIQQQLEVENALNLLEKDNYNG